MTLEQYIDNINKRYKLGNATEHTFRGDLQTLLESLVPDIRATNEPKRQSCGAPDYILTKGDIPVGFIEAKDIGDKDLEGAKKTGNKEQFDRYKASLNNLIFTDYLDFHLYIDGIFITKIAIARIEFPSSGGAGVVVPLPNNFATFTNLIKDFCSHIGQTIKSSKKLAEMMAGKARLLSDVIEKALTSDEENKEDSTLKDQMNAFKQILIHDITPKGFADVYAQTISYGMFAARLHDPTLPTFSRQEAAELIPKSNPFLRKLFGYIAGPDIDDRIKWIVDSLIDIFLACNVEEILKNYGKSTKMEDPIIHFYETFLSEYDPKLRKARGVWYTPAPVVNFIVRAVDDILKTEFDLPQGLADSSKINHPSPSKGGELVHKVQILDPATGTGTFLAETIKHIHATFEGQQGIWSKYVETHLLPRLNGFELLMASYAMAHLKLDLLLTETGYKPTTNQRFRVYLTNSLEESHPDTGTLFANWLSTEANEANHIKRDTPVMCVIGNPPYSISTTNKSKWIENLITDYKKDLNERKLNLDDDYIKFIRYGQHHIDKNGSGILAYISNNSFIDGITHRQMRKNLLESFDKIYILDLHGNSRIKETCVDGSPDYNVFDIMQGVSINIFVKTGKKKKTELGQVFHSEIQGKREFKYDFLNERNFKTITWVNIKYQEPYNFFVPKDFKLEKENSNGFKVTELFELNSNGLETHKDEITIQHKKTDLSKIVKDFVELSENEIKTKYSITKEGSEWQVGYAKKDAEKYPNSITSLVYRPFDNRFTLFTPNSKGFLARPRFNVLKHLKYPNLALLVKRQCKQNFSYAFVVKDICEACVFESAFAKNNVLPLYLYPETKGQQTIGQSKKRTPNLNTEIVKQIAEKLGLSFTNEKTTPSYGHPSNGGEFAPIDLLDYIYAVLHSPTYREKYKEFLKIDFPRVPYPKNKDTFWKLVKLGGEIRQIHLLESPTVEKYITQYPIDGNNVVVKPRFVNSPPLEGCPQDGVVNKQTTNVVNKQTTQEANKTVVLATINNQIIFRNFVDNLPYNPKLKPLLKEKRKAGILSEVLFWQQVHKNKFHKIDFDRQRIIGNYIVDFYVKTLGLVIEIDGSSHDDKQDYDRDRQHYLESLGLKVFRITDADVKKNIERAMQELEAYIIEQYGVGSVYEPPRPAGTPPTEGNFSQDVTKNTDYLKDKTKKQVGKVYINDTQYFDNVPQVAWEFYIGGYQPAQKWLKDRKERTLEFDDILHYQKIIVALTETDRLMKEIENIEIE